MPGRLSACRMASVSSSSVMGRPLSTLLVGAALFEVCLLAWSVPPKTYGAVNPQSVIRARAATPWTDALLRTLGFWTGFLWLAITGFSIAGPGADGPGCRARFDYSC